MAVAESVGRARRPATTGLRQYLGDVFWAARIIAGLAIVLAGGAWPSLWHQVSFLIGLAILTYAVRAVRWGTVYNLFLVGGIFSLVIIAIQYVVEIKVIGREHEAFRAVVIAGVSEELLKIAPLVVLLAFPRLPFRYGYGATDLMLCGAALGAGFGFVEYILLGWRAFPPAQSPRVFGYPIFNDSFNGFIGHGGSTALIALAIGWLIYAMRWKKAMLFGWIAVGVATYWMMVDHGLANYRNYTSPQDWFAPVRWMWSLDRQGQLSPYVILFVLVATMIVERAFLWRILRGIPRLKMAACLNFIVQPFRNSISYLAFRTAWTRLRRLMLYVLSFRQLGYLVLHGRGNREMNREPVARLIVRRTGEVGITQLAVKRS